MNGSNEKRQKILLTGLWKERDDGKGETVYKGPLAYGCNLMLVKNAKKENGKSPDLLLFIVPKERGDDQTGAGLDGEIPF
jgi:hypothetical protein